MTLGPQEMYLSTNFLVNRASQWHAQLSAHELAEQLAYLFGYVYISKAFS